MLHHSKFLFAALGLMLVGLSAHSHAMKVRQATAVASTEGGWSGSQSQNARRLDYSAKVFLLGKASQITLSFYVDTTETQQEHGALGFDLTLRDIANLKAFNFDAFEGPDATAGGKKLLRTTLYKAGKVEQTLDLSPSGSIPELGAFAFGVAAITAEPSSDPKTLLRALERGGDILMISITDPGNPKLKLEFPVSVTGKEADFKTLLSDVK